MAVKNVITCDDLVVRLRSLRYLTASATRALSLDSTTSTDSQVQVLTDVRYAATLHTVKTLCQDSFVDTATTAPRLKFGVSLPFSLCYVGYAKRARLTTVWPRGGKHNAGWTTCD